MSPERKTIHREVGQPGFIQAFERTPIVAKIPGYVLKWHVDIGDNIHKDQVLAELWAPEMVSELKVKEELVLQAEKALAMAKAQVVTARAQIEEARAAVGRAQATHDYWKGQSEHFTSLVKDSVLDKQAQEDALNQFRSAAPPCRKPVPGWSRPRPCSKKRNARDKAEVDIRVAEAERAGKRTWWLTPR